MIFNRLLMNQKLNGFYYNNKKNTSNLNGIPSMLFYKNLRIN